MSDKNECSICEDEFDPESEGGIEGYLGMIPFALCPTCLAGLANFFLDEGYECADDMYFQEDYV